MPASRPALLLSLAIHAAVVALLFSVLSLTEARLRDSRPLGEVFRERMRLIAPRPMEGGGGGGENSPLPPSKGRLPRMTPKPFVPPSPQLRQARLTVEPAIAGPEDVAMPQLDLAQYGDPLASSRFASGGPGQRGGIGKGCCGGVGDHTGPGYGDGPPGGISLRAVTGATAPVLIYQVDPEYSEEARKAKYQGTVVLVALVDAAGRVTGIRVTRSLGLGLDEKAVEAVTRWKFRPARKDGRAVSAPALIEVNFRLL